MRTFAEFWPHYVREHAHRGNRCVHFLGTLSAVVLLGAVFVTGRWWLALAVPVVGYGSAWAGHLLLQKNRPATFRHPLWSLLGDFKMFGLMATGRMEAELAKALRGPDEPSVRSRRV